MCLLFESGTYLFKAIRFLKRVAFFRKFAEGTLRGTLPWSIPAFRCTYNVKKTDGLTDDSAPYINSHTRVWVFDKTTVILSFDFHSRDHLATITDVIVTSYQ